MADHSTEKKDNQEIENETMDSSVQEEPIEENSDIKETDHPTEDTENPSLEEELQEMKGKYLRLVAEFDNFRKRTNRERIEMMNTAAEKTVKALLPVLDDFDRAKRSAEDEHTDEVFSDGVLLVYDKLYKVLHNVGLESMNSNDEVFNPEFHEAITDLNVQDESKKGKVIDTIEKGYMLNDKIIRYAKVVVGK